MAARPTGFMMRYSYSTTSIEDQTNHKINGALKIVSKDNLIFIAN